MRVRWRGLELPSKVHSDRGTLTDMYGKFHVEPFERGFGMTIGNSLRRILLSSLEGSAITKVKIQGVQHEVSTITGVVEDVTDIILNIKSLVVKNLSDQPKVIRIQKHEPGAVRGVDVQHDETIQIINPEHHIATLIERRVVRDGDDRRERPRLPDGRGQRRQGTRDRRHPGR